MYLITGWGATWLGLRRLCLQGVFGAGCFPGPLWWVPAVGRPKTQPALGWSSLGFHCTMLCPCVERGGTPPAPGPQPIATPTPGEPEQPAGLDQPQPQAATPLPPASPGRPGTAGPRPPPWHRASPQARTGFVRAAARCPACLRARGKRCSCPMTPPVVHLPCA